VFYLPKLHNYLVFCLVLGCWLGVKRDVGFFRNCGCCVFCVVKFFMAIGQSKVLAGRTYGVADGAAAPTSPDRGK
jgi:hypothetical protein